MGSPEFAVPSLDALLAAGHELVAVYAQPPRPAGRGKSARKTAVHERAERLGIEVRTPRTLRDPEEQERFRQLRADYGVVAAYGLLLPAEILSAPAAGCINVHASLLPRWRGAAPIQRAILAGDEVTGITLMKMDEGLDTGAMLATIEAPIGGKTAGELANELAALGGCLLKRYFEQPSDYPPRPQPLYGATYARKVDKAEAQLDFKADASLVQRQVRAFNPVPGAWFEFEGERIKVWQAEVTPDQGMPGIVKDARLTIACGEQAIRPLTLQRAGKSRVHVDEFLRGYPIPEGSHIAPTGQRIQ